MLTLHTERGTKPSPTHNNKMKTEQRKEIAKAIKMPMCNAFIFHTLEDAARSVRRSNHKDMAVKVEDEYWVVTPKDAHRLEKLGHEIISPFSIFCGSFCSAN